MDTPEPRRRGRQGGHFLYGEPTAAMRVPISAKAEVVEFLNRRRRSSRTAVPRPQTIFAGGEALTVLRAAQDPAPFEIPSVANRIPAGFPSPADDYVEEGCDLNKLLVHHPHATYFMTVSGDSVNRRNIVDGDRVIVDCSVEPKHDDIVVAVINGEGHTIKVLYKTDTEVALEPDSTNPIHKRRVMGEFDEWIIWGVVTSAVRIIR